MRIAGLFRWTDFNSLHSFCLYTSSFLSTFISPHFRNCFTPTHAKRVPNEWSVPKKKRKRKKGPKLSQVEQIKHWPNGVASQRKFAKREDWTCVRACEGWPNGFASRLASSRKSQKVVNFTHIQLTRDQLVSTCVGWPNGEKLASTWVRITQ